MKSIINSVKIIIALFLIYVSSVPVAAQSSAVPAHIHRALDSISMEQGLDVITELASNRYGGRLTGSDGQRHTAEFIRDHFIQANLKPFGGKSDYYQKLSLATNQILPTPVLKVKTSGYEYTDYVFGKNFICAGFSGSGDIRSEVVFCGYGITTDTYDDYEDVDVDGKTVLILAGYPSNADDLHNPHAWNAIGKKANLAKENGAASMMMVRLLPDGTVRRLINSVVWGDHPYLPDFPIVVIDRFISTDILENSKQELPVLRDLIDKHGKPLSFHTETNAHLKVRSEFNPVGETENVIGLIEGSHPTLKNEYVVIGAHMDHVGIQGANIIFPGANDNASGVASLIQIAQAFDKTGLQPKRSIIFVAFTGEEMGLKGSQYFVDNLPFDKRRIKYMINLDMVGGGSGGFNSFSREYPEVSRLVRKANNDLHNLRLNVHKAGYGSDHGSFHRAGLPCTMFLNSGKYNYPYHHTHYQYREWMINLDLWKQITDTAFLTLWYMAN